MARGRGRPRKSEVTELGGGHEGERRGLRAAAQAAIDKVMDLHNLSVKPANHHQDTANNSIRLDNSEHVTADVNESTKSDDQMSDQISSNNQCEEDSSAPIIKSPSKSWTSAIWGESKHKEPPARPCTADITNDLKPEPPTVTTRFSSRVAAKSKDSQSNSSGSTASTTSTPKAASPESAKAGKTQAASRSKKKEGRSRIKRRIRTLSDSEDSSVSTDSPLKPKTYTEDLTENNDTTPVSKKSTRIPKKTKEAVQVSKPEAMEVDDSSPVEEPPLIPKGFMEQQKKEQELRHRLEEIPAVQKEENEEERREKEESDRMEVERRLKSFKQLKENQYLCKKYVNKETRKLQCECVLSKEELQQGEKGCGEDCLNRLIYIECGKYCLLENNCSNKSFQNNSYADVEVFKTDWKGVGLRARSNIAKDTFIMEYVGEVLDTRLFKKRAKNYSKDGVKHFYFMALSKDQFVDATLKGNISRFINHSCEPNAETQKWTVNGEIRVGFFTTKNIRAGQEICFDYKFERYGNVAQECFCGADNCKRWIGGEPTSDSGIEEVEEWSEDDDDEEEEEEIQETAKKEIKKKEKKKREKKPKKYEVDDYEEELQRLVSTGVRNKMQTVQLCRLMVRATKASKPQLADLLIEADQACIRLFLDYQGLKILYSWMYMLGWSLEELELKLKIETLLSIIQFPHKTMLIETKVHDTVERWRTDSPGEGEGLDSAPVSRATTPTPAPSRVESPEDNNSETPVEESAEMCVGAVLKSQAEVGSEKQDSLELESEKMDDGVAPIPREQLPLSETEEKMREAESGRVTELSAEQKMIQDIQARAGELLAAWAGLQEMFRIPKKERQAERREHEREADRGSQTREREEFGGRRQMNGYRSYQDVGHGVLRGGYTAPTPAPAVSGNRRNLRLDDRTGRLCHSNLHRDDRRMLFQAKVEEETRQKVLRTAVTARHDQCCKLIGLDPALTPLLPKYPEFYLSAGKWIPMPPPPLSIDPAWTTPMMAALPQEAFRPGDPPLPNPRSIYPPGCCPELPLETPQKSLNTIETEAEICAHYDKLYYGSRSSSPLSAAISAQLERRRHESGGSVDISPDYRSPSPANRSPSPPTSVPFLSSSDPSEQLLETHRQQESAQHQDQSLSHEVKSDNSHLESASVKLGPHQPRAAAGEAGGGLVVRLPPRWRVARDNSGRVYFYHALTKQVQWDPPTEDQEEEDEVSGSNLQETQQSYRIETAETDSEEDHGEEGEDTDTEDDSEEETEENGAPDPEPEVREIPDSDLSASEKRMLLRMRRRTKEERRNMRRLKREKFKERHEQERLVTRERHKRHRRDGLVEEHLVPARISDKDKLDLMTFKEMRERLLNKDKIREEQMKEEREEEEKEKREERARLEKIKREERRAMEKAKREADSRQLVSEEQMDISLDISVSESNLSMTEAAVQSTPQPSVTSTSQSSSRTTQAAADTSSDVQKKHKDKFLKEMSKVVVKILDPYRKKGVKGHIGNTDDFKHLAKKLTFTIMHKELKVCKNTEELKANEKVKKKASDYVSKYMKKYDREYKRSPNQED